MLSGKSVSNEACPIEGIDNITWLGQEGEPSCEKFE
jgi:hypothetical protein